MPGSSISATSGNSGSLACGHLLRISSPLPCKISSGRTPTFRFTIQSRSILTPPAVTTIGPFDLGERTRPLNEQKIDVVLVVGIDRRRQLEDTRRALGGTKREIASIKAQGAKQGTGSLPTLLRW